MLLPSLSDWTSTRVGLHQAAQVVGAIRKALARPEPNWLHLALTVAPDGLTTGSLPSLGEFLLDFRNLKVIFRAAGKAAFELPLAGHTQISLADAAIQAFASSGYVVQLDRARLTGDTLIDVDARTADDALDALHVISGVLEHFRARLPGEKSPVVVWPHGFDMSFLWFATDAAEESAPHMAFGFSPYSAGLERPYVYTYAYPLPDNLTRIGLPMLAHWHTQGWTGTVTPYDDLRREPDPVAALKHTLESIFAAVSPLVGKP